MHNQLGGKGEGNGAVEKALKEPKHSTPQSVTHVLIHGTWMFPILECPASVPINAPKTYGQGEDEECHHCTNLDRGEQLLGASEQPVWQEVEADDDGCDDN
jgi:hypothetical protein